MARGREFDTLFGNFVHLQHLPRANEAQNMLKKLASVVKPIMRKRNWRVGQLGEFLPEAANLLGERLKTSMCAAGLSLTLAHQA